eukprot:m.213282 g.213282  ORF g.213282 m.213282 type:complete len:141 (-) comp15859_c0_seq22:1227-1649(-)
MHQSDLLHGVEVLSGERWSWIIWYKDSSTCSNDRPAYWNQEEVSAKDPIALFLHAYRVHMTPGISKETAQQEKFQLLLASAELGFPRAMNDVGTLYNTGAGVELNETTARFWFQRAANEGHADGNIVTSLVIFVYEFFRS